jgi:hypothetical protein
MIIRTDRGADLVDWLVHGGWKPKLFPRRKRLICPTLGV